MSDRGPLVTYEVTWMNGHVERVQAHVVNWSVPPMPWAEPASVRQTVDFYGEIDGRWRLVLHALAEDIRTVRDAATERLDGAS